MTTTARARKAAGEPWWRRTAVITTLLVIAVSAALNPWLQQFDPYAGNGGPMLFHLTPRHAVHLIDVALMFVVTVVSVVVARTVRRYLRMGGGGRARD